MAESSMAAPDHAAWGHTRVAKDLSTVGSCAAEARTQPTNKTHGHQPSRLNRTRMSIDMRRWLTIAVFTIARESRGKEVISGQGMLDHTGPGGP